MANMYTITVLLSERLSQARYHIRTGEQLNAAPVRFVASKMKFIIPVLALMSTHIVVLEKDEAKPNDMDNLFDMGFMLAKRINRIPLLRGMQFGYSIIPLIVGKNPDSELLLYAALSPETRFSLFKFPVVMDLTRHQVAYFEGFKKFGGVIWPILQKIVTTHIEPLVDELSPEKSEEPQR